VTKDQYILDNRVRYWGEGVAAVAATSEEIAEEALDLIEVDYEPLPAVFTIEEAMAAGAPKIHDDGRPGNDVLPPVVLRRGDVEKGFSEAALVLEGEYELGRPTAAYMEPNVCLCEWDANGKLIIHTSTQSAFMVRGTLAEVLGLPLNKVRVLVDHMGGGFGAKQDIFQHEFLWQGDVPRGTIATLREDLAQTGLQQGRCDRRAAGAHPFQFRRLRIARARGHQCVGRLADLALSLRKHRCRRTLPLHEHADRRRLPGLRRRAELLRA
jgi:CO/xanthine dehydrogenase Mo-binding subunit